MLSDRQREQRKEKRVMKARWRIEAQRMDPLDLQEEYIRLKTVEASQGSALGDCQRQLRIAIEQRDDYRAAANEATAKLMADRRKDGAAAD